MYTIFDMLITAGKRSAHEERVTLYVCPSRRGLSGAPELKHGACSHPPDQFTGIQEGSDASPSTNAPVFCIRTTGRPDTTPVRTQRAGYGTFLRACARTGYPARPGKHPNSPPISSVQARPLARGRTQLPYSAVSRRKPSLLRPGASVLALPHVSKHECSRAHDEHLYKRSGRQFLPRTKVRGFLARPC
jgi:hypothetical protein